MPARYIARESPFGPIAAAVLRLWSAHLHGMTPEKAAHKMRHWYQENPAGSGACVVLQSSAEAEPVGVQCLLERRHWQGDAAVQVAGLAEFAIDPGHRSLGPALSLLKKCLEIGHDRFGLVYGLPNPNAFSVCKRAGLVHLGDMIRFVLPLRLGLLLRRRNARAMRWLAWPADFLLRGLVRARAIWLRAPQRWRDASFGGPDVAVLWAGRSHEISFAERANGALDWRFNQGIRWRLAIAYAAASRPLGYVVWRQVDDLVQVGDFFCVQPARQTAALLAGFARLVDAEVGANGVDLEFCGRPAVAQGILRAGFLRRDVMCPVLVDRAPAAGGIPIERLFFTRFDRVSD